MPHRNYLKPRFPYSAPSNAAGTRYSRCELTWPLRSPPSRNGRLAAPPSSCVSMPHGADCTSRRSRPHGSVSEADRESEELLRAPDRRGAPRRRRARRGGSGRAGTSGMRWVVDPLDGTTTTSTGIPLDGLGRVRGRRGAARRLRHDPSLDETFSAARGHGATLGGEPIRVPGERPRSRRWSRPGSPTASTSDGRRRPSSRGCSVACATSAAAASAALDLC